MQNATATPQYGQQFIGQTAQSLITPPSREGWEFTGWTIIEGSASIPSGGGNQTCRVNSVSSGANHIKLLANWNKTTIGSLIVSAGAGGTATGSKSNMTITDNTSVVSATANSGYEFTGWTGTGTPYLVGNVFTLPAMGGNYTLIANFSAIGMGSLTVSAGAGGTATGSKSNMTIIDNTSVVSATPDSGYEFTGWTGTGTPYLVGNVFTLPDSGGNFTLIANFRATTIGSLTVSAGAGGSASGSKSFTSSDKTSTVSATANSGYEFTGWTGTGMPYLVGNVFTLPASGGNFTLIANFSAKPPINQTVSAMFYVDGTDKNRICHTITPPVRITNCMIKQSFSGYFSNGEPTSNNYTANCTGEGTGCWTFTGLKNLTITNITGPAHGEGDWGGDHYVQDVTYTWS